MLPSSLFDLKQKYCKELGIEGNFNTSCKFMVITGYK